MAFDHEAIARAAVARLKRKKVYRDAVGQCGA
jgi:hypothetical protein